MLQIGWVFIAVIITLSAEQLVLITHPQSPIDILTQTQVRMIYLKKRRFWGETKLIALNLPPDNNLRKTFEHETLEMRQTQLESYWVKQHYKGHRPPYRVESVQSMILFVKKVKGAVGYIPLSKVDAGVKVIYKEVEP